MSYFYFKPRTKQAWLNEKEISSCDYKNKYSNGEHYCYFISGDKLGKIINFCVIWNKRKKTGSLCMKKRGKEEQKFFFAEIESDLYKSIVDLKEEESN